MTTRTRHTVRIGDPGELIAAVPHLLGFHPHDSLVLVTRRGRGEPLGPTVRADVPAAAEDETPLCRHLVGVLVSHHIRSVLAVVVGGGQGRPPRSLLAALGATLDERGLALEHGYEIAEILAGVRWRCCGPDACGGELPAPAASRLAVAGVLDGEVTFASRGELESLLMPDHPDVLSRRRGGLARRRSVSMPARTALELLLEHIEGAGFDAANAALDDETVVELLVALTAHRVRDAVLWPGRHPEAAERLWLALARGAPAPERAEPACLAGLCAYLRGNGALANIALQAAENADPGHHLTQLLLAAAGQAMAPAELGELVRAGSVHARAELLGTDVTAATGPAAPE
jgi:hypothetical protein